MDLFSHDTDILIVEDNANYAQILQRILSQTFGYKKITLVGTVEEAEAIIEQNPERFNLMFIDYHLPHSRTGGQLLSTLKTHNLLNDKIAFLITAEPNMDSMREALNAGASGVLAKPFNREQVKSQLQKAQRDLDSAEVEGF